MQPPLRFLVGVVVVLCERNTHIMRLRTVNRANSSDAIGEALSSLNTDDYVFKVHYIANPVYIHTSNFTICF
jgi:hypothetical protein